MVLTQTRRSAILLDPSSHTDIVRFKIEVGVEEKCTKMLTPFPMDFPHMPEHAVIIDDVIIVGRHLLRTYVTREARM